MGQVIGVDEVGRGCLAGPLLVVAARATGELPSVLP
ncbi:ribonuclease HII, partial [Candidatus Saccharibacteria bacterium]|nr:ribonuclease HII [Candidatus Saccharibacteria bacterium]